MAASQYTCEAVPVRGTGTGQPRGPFSCSGCGLVYMTRRFRGQGEKYCGRKCSYAHKTELAREKIQVRAGSFSVVHFKKCTRCEKAFVARNALAVYCGRRCATEEATHRRYGANPARGRECVVCGVSYCSLPEWRKELRSCCSLGCKAVCDRARRSAERAKRKRRIRRHGVKVWRINPLRVFRRDSWTCQGCGCHTPLEMRGTMDDNAPELDHIVAVSKGGSHSEDNLQTLCRVCNIFKSDKNMDEFLMLIGRGRGVALQRLNV
jgi:5-methylcytosine-specific restriction endonuclease McrA